MTTSDRLDVLEAVAAVVEDPARFLGIISDCHDEDEARTRVMHKYGVCISDANHLLETTFRRKLHSQRARIHQEITVHRRDLAG